MPDTERLCRKHAVISGRVQGVGFRRYALDKAESLGLTGWVRNLPDRSVELCFQGDIELVNEMEDWCYRGSPCANVKNVIISDKPIALGEMDFEIR